GSNGCTSMDNVTVTVDPATVPGTVNGTTSICEGYSTGMLTLTGNTGAVVKWQKRLNSGSWTDISNNTGFYSEIPASTGTWSYRAVVQSGVCNADFSTPAVITVSSLSVGGSISGSATICEGLPTGTLILSGYNGSIIKWRKRLNSGSWMDISNTSVVYNEIPDTSGIWDYQAIVQNSACDLDSSAIVSVIVNPIPIADAGADQIVCSGSSVTLAGSGGLYYSWNNSVTNGIPFVPATTGTYTVTVTNSYGCTSTDNMVVTVNSLPVANAGADQSVCAGQSITLCANGGNTYQWDNSVTNCVQFTPVATVTYHVTVTDANNCSATDNVLVTVNSLPTANAGSDQTVCEGTSVTLSATGGTSYNWDNGVINGIAFTPTTTTTYTVTVTNADNCTATDSVIITVNPLPAAAGVITGSAIVCQNQTSVVYSIPVISNAVAYVWTLPSGFSGTSNSNTVTVNIDVSAVSGSITVKGQNTCGFGTISTLAVTVNPLPLAAGSISGASTVCQGQNSVLYSLPSVTNATSYNWTLPTGATGSSTTNSISLNFGTSAITDNITVKGTNTCGSGASSQMLITVNQLPVPAGIISGVSSVCQGQSNVDYTVPLITNANTYVWSLPSGVSGTSSTNNITVSFGFNAQSGNVTVKGQNACGDGQISILPITVNPVPITPVITQNGSILQSDAINGNQWYMNNAIIPGATGQNYTPSQNGNYFVIVTSTYGCSSDTSNILQFNTGIEEILQAGSFKVFPNPNQGTFNVQFDLNQTQEISIVILDFLGKEIYSEKSQKQNGKLDRSIDLSNSAAGIYTLILKIGDNQLIEKLSIIK
ncbi:MAG: T9SS type A sorting domain-containing protein, partial [Bacteroidia bacterium]|nr:T9SS type A sorting domain-containing protein [Bacteroidia bacterium]